LSNAKAEAEELRAKYLEMKQAGDTLLELRVRLLVTGEAIARMGEKP